MKMLKREKYMYICTIK